MAFDVSRDQLNTMVLYDYKSGVNAGKSYRKINAAFGDNTISRTTHHEWFEKFQQCVLDIQDKCRNGRSSEVDNDALRAVVSDNPHLTSLQFRVGHVTTLSHLNDIGTDSKLDRWVPHQLSNHDWQRRMIHA